MKVILKTIFFLSLLFLTSMETVAQDEMFRQKSDPRPFWKRWRRTKGGYNPYLVAKAKNKPSARIAQGNKRDLKRQKRTARRELRKNKGRFGAK
ncbi:MAG: hypothetical protein HYX39_08410 [Bacteroidetes bacterium]|nr:hypothetical protein [Bacteroidota bacterium]